VGQKKAHIDDTKKQNRHAGCRRARVVRLGNKKEEENENGQHHDGQNRFSLTETGSQREAETETYRGDFFPQSNFWKGEPVEFNEALARSAKDEEEESCLLAEANDQNDERSAHKAC